METPDHLAEAVRVAKERVPAAAVVVWATVGVLVSPFLLRHRTRLRFGLRLAASVAAIGGATAILVQSTEDEPRYYKRVAELVEQHEVFRGKRLVVLGCVANGSLERAQGGSPRYRFKLRDLDRKVSWTIEATGRGEVPDNLRESRREVVVEGRLTPDDRLEILPDGIMTKCPSKYDGSAPTPSNCPGLDE